MLKKEVLCDQKRHPRDIFAPAQNQTEYHEPPIVFWGLWTLSRYSRESRCFWHPLEISRSCQNDLVWVALLLVLCHHCPGTDRYRGGCLAICAMWLVKKTNLLGSKSIFTNSQISRGGVLTSKSTRRHLILFVITGWFLSQLRVGFCLHWIQLFLFSLIKVEWLFWFS